MDKALKILEDKGQKVGQHELKNDFFKSNGIEVERYPLPVGDYVVCTEKAQDVIDRKNKRGIKPEKIDFLGSYTVSVDTKENMLEIYGNICNGEAHARFRDECILAQNNGIKLYVLVENEDGIECLDDVTTWYNPRMNRYLKIQNAHERGKMKGVNLPEREPTNGAKLAKSMRTMQERYGVEFRFCHPKHAGEKVMELLSEEKAGKVEKENE